MEIFDLLKKHDKGELTYKESVALFFSIYPQKKSALASFFEVEDSFALKKLNDGLNQKLIELETNTQHNSFKTFLPSVMAHQGRINVDVLPTQLREEYARLSPIIREIAHLHARLENALSNNHRYHLCKKIVDLTKERRSILNKVDEFNATGTYTEPIKVVKQKLDTSRPINYEVLNKIHLLRSRRSKLKNKPEKVAEYNRVVEEINALEAQRYA